MKILWCDTETTGLDPENAAPFQVSFIFVYSETSKNKIIKTESDRCFFLNPLTDKIIYNPEAGKIHGYSEEKIKSFENPLPALKKIDTALNDFFRFKNEEKMYFAGYNCDFDKKHMIKLFSDYGYDFQKYFHEENIDVFLQVKKAIEHGIITNLKSKKLSCVAEHLEIEFQNAHDARADIQVTRQIAARLQKLGEKLINF